MATINSSTYLDDGTARSVGEAFTVNGCTFTIRTDTRVHANAPASMTGIVGTVSLINDAIFKIDATKVRWMAYSSGSGNVPAIGTIITQGAVSGYLLGVWSSYTSAPTTPGTAMPATGWIKFREVTGGSFEVGALTGITASATEADRVGWIEVVKSTASTNTNTSAPNGGIITDGDWFYLGTTNGTVGQIVQAPTNGGGANTFINAIQIETGVGTGIYEWYGTTLTTTFTNVYLGTDLRCKVVYPNGGGAVTIGSGGTTAGYVPPSGCKIRIPNIFLRSAASGSAATNTKTTTSASTTANLSGISTANINKFDLKFVSSEWLNNFGHASEVNIENSCFPGSTAFTCLANYVSANFDNVCISAGTLSSGPTAVSYFKNGTFNNCTFVGAGTFTALSSLDFTNCKFIVTTTTAAGAAATTFTNCNDTTFTNIGMIGTGFQLTDSKNITIDTLDFCHAAGINVTSSRTGVSVLSITNSSGIGLSGLTFGLNNTYSLSFPYVSMFAFSFATNVNIKNIGTLTSPATVYDGTVAPQYMVSFTNENKDIKFKRVYLSRYRSAQVLASGTTENIEILNCGTPHASSTNTTFSQLVNGKIRGFVCGSTGVTLPDNTQYFSPYWSDRFTVEGSGRVGVTLMNKSRATLYKVDAQSTSFYGNDKIYINNPSDYVITEQEYFVKGHTGFKNVAPSIVSGGSALQFLIEYQIDTGSGWNGTWKELIGSNLSAEVISPSTGFKLKFRVFNIDTPGTSTYIQSIIVETTTTTTAQTENMYPLDTYQFSLTGLATGSEVRVYSGTNPSTSAEIGGIEATSGSTFNFQHSSPNQDGYIVILAMGYQPIYLPYTFKAAEDQLLIQQVIDRNYANPV